MNTIPFNKLPEYAQIMVRNDLYLYDKTYIAYEFKRYTTSPHIALTATAKADDFQMFVITRDEVFTKEEQEENRKVFKEETKNMDWEWFGQ